MTLIINISTNYFCLQVSDRLLTYDGGKKFDQQSNKSIVLITEDAAVLFGYSGIGFVKGHPTDKWMANILSGGRMLCEGRFPFLTSTPDRPDKTPFRKKLFDLKQAMSKISLPREYPYLEATFSGREFRDGHEVTISGRIVTTYNRTVFRDMHKFCPHNHARFLVTPSNGRNPVTPMYMSEISRTLTAHRTPNDKMALLENIMAAAVRAQAGPGSTIGENLTGISMYRVGSNPLLIEIKPLQYHRHQINLDRANGPLDCFYSPSVITPSLITAPATVVGDGFQIETGGVIVNISLPPSRQANDSTVFWGADKRRNAAAPTRFI